MTTAGELPIDLIAARSGLVNEFHSPVTFRQFGRDALQVGRCVGDVAPKPHFTPALCFCHGDGDRFLVNIQTGMSSNFVHGNSPYKDDGMDLAQFSQADLREEFH